MELRRQSSCAMVTSEGEKSRRTSRNMPTTLRRFTVPTLLILLAVYSPAAAQTKPTPARPQAATTSADNAEIGALRAKAETGDALAQYNLGVSYRDGDGIPQNVAQAAGWFRKAADQGLASAQFNLGVLYDQRSRFLASQRK